MNDPTDVVPIPKPKRARKKPPALLRVRLRFTANDPIHLMLTSMGLDEESKSRPLCMTALNHYAVLWMKPNNTGSSDIDEAPLRGERAEDVVAKPPSMLAKLKKRAARIDFGDLVEG